MDAADFVTATLSHFVTRPDAPAPGVPALADAGFETRLCALCVDHGLSAVVARSLERLALPPAISSVTALRLRRHAEQAVALTERRLSRLGGLLEVLDAAGAEALVMGDVLSACALYPPGAAGDAGLRAVGTIELLVDETRAGDVLRSAAAVGFSQRRSDPSLEPTPAAPPTLRAARDLVEFHHYMAPLVLWSADGDRVRVRFRAVESAHPAGREWAWERSRAIDVAGRDARAVSLEDHAVDLALRLGASRYADLARLTDLGLLLSQRGVRWDRVTAIARAGGVHTAVHHALRHVTRVLGLGAEPPVDPPPALLTRCLDLFQLVESVDYDAAPREFLYPLVACGGPIAKLVWAWRHAVPRRDWVERVVGNASNPWSWLTFQLIVRERAESRGGGATRRRGGGNVTRIDRGEE
jgi:hypothetical protein